MKDTNNIRKKLIMTIITAKSGEKNLCAKNLHKEKSMNDLGTRTLIRFVGIIIEMQLIFAKP